LFAEGAAQQREKIVFCVTLFEKIGQTRKERTVTSAISYFSRRKSACMLDQAKAGDPVALGPLLASYSRQLHRVAGAELDNKLRNRVSPSDIVQDTLLQATQDFQSFRGHSEAEFVSWLQRILARQLAKSIERHLLAEKRDVRREAVVNGSAWHETPSCRAVADHRPGPSSEAVQVERNNQVEQALVALPQTYREIIQLRNAEGLPFDEIAVRLHRTSGAARMLWLRAIDMLRQQLIQQDSK
jgi:RNA polymerase sigma-70 factor, ECF subfamily